MDDLMQDLRFALRSFAKHPGFACAAVLTIALGIGTSTAVFALVDAALFRPLPFPSQARAVALHNTFDPSPPGSPKRALDFTDWQSEREVFEQIGATAQGGLNLGSPNGATRIRVTQATSNLFALLGSQPLLGRTFAAAETVPGGDGVAVLSDGLWRREFGGDSEVLGRSVTLNDRAFVVVGVMPPGFTYPSLTDIWIPYTVPRNPANYEMFRTRVPANYVARLAVGVSLLRARALVSAVEQRFRASQPNSSPPQTGMTIVPLRDELVGDSSTAMFVLFGASGLILLIASANTAGLLIARSAERNAEVALRSALGASRSRLIRQFLVESLFLGTCGGLLGLCFAWIGRRALYAFVPTALLDVNPLTLGIRVWLFASLALLVVTLVSGMAPALIVSRTQLMLSMPMRRGESRIASGRSRSAFVALQIALVLPLLAGAGAMLKTVIRLQHADIGFRTADIGSFGVALPSVTYESAARIRGFYRTALDRISALPGVEASGAVTILPLAAAGAAAFRVQVVGQPPIDPQARPAGEFLVATPGYFRTMGITLIQGRTFNDGDGPNARPSIVLSETLARRLFPSGSPLGAEVNLPGNPTAFSVIGVVRDIRSQHPTGPDSWQGQMYIVHDQLPSRFMTIVVRASSPPATLVPLVRRAIASVDATVPLYDVRAMDDVLASAMTPQDLTSRMLTLGALLALLLAPVGIYGMVRQTVIQRTQEFGVRRALGATDREVLRLTLSRGMLPVVLGLCAGLIAAWVAAGVLKHLVYDMSPRDPMTLTIGSVVLMAASFVACYVPARRALRVDPAIALRGE